MGKSLSTANDYGNISIQLEHSKYTAGDQVNGWIYLSLMRNFPSSVLYLIITGKERVHLATEVETNKLDSNPPHRRLKETKIHKDKNEFFAHTFPLHSQTGSFFPYGQYSFPFTFKLLENLPGTFEDEWEEYGVKCFAKTNYKLWAGMKEPSGKLALFTKQYFSVDQRFEHSMGAQLRNYQKNLKGYCYSDLGEIRMNCRFEKDKYFVGENAMMTYEVDNTKCKSDVKKIKCQLVQTSRYGTATTPNIKIRSEVLSTVEVDGLKAGEARMGVSAYPVMLMIKTKSEKQATSTHGLINNTFQLSIATEMNDCLCCEAEPATSIDIKVYNRPPSNYKPFTPGPNWNPQVMSPYVCTISNEYRMTREFKDEAFQPHGGPSPLPPAHNAFPPAHNAFPPQGPPPLPPGHNAFAPQSPNNQPPAYNDYQPQGHNAFPPQGHNAFPPQPQNPPGHNAFPPRNN
jgi:hypothetical protein